MALMRLCQWGLLFLLLCLRVWSVFFCFFCMNCSWRWANGARVSPRLTGIVSLHSPGASAYQPRRTRRVSFCGVSSHTFPSQPHPVGFVQWRTSGPSRRATCTYCWSHALTPPNWISRSHMLCRTVESAGPCSFVMKVLSLFLSSSFQLLLIGRYFSDESIYILCVCVCVCFVFIFLATCWIC